MLWILVTIIHWKNDVKDDSHQCGICQKMKKDWYWLYIFMVDNGCQAQALCECYCDEVCRG